MKKNYLMLLAGLMIILLSSCVSTNLNLITKENVETLTSKSFKVTDVSVFSGQIPLAEKIQAESIIKNFPIDKIKNDLLTEYGITLDTSLLSENNIESKIGQLVTDKGQKLNSWALEKSTEENIPSAYIRLVVSKNNNEPMLLSVQTTLTDSEGNSLSHIYAESNWNPVQTIANKETAAIINFASHITPEFVTTKDGIQSYKSYCTNNAAPDGGIYVDTDSSVIIYASVYDPGVFMVIDPMYFNNTVIRETYESGKSYTIKYEVDRSTFSKYDWKIVYSKTEN